MPSYNIALLRDFCNTHNIQLIGDYIVVNQTTIINAHCLTINCTNIVNKRLDSFLNTNSYCDVCTKQNTTVVW